ncbi:MAG: hypothetical protein FJ102_20940, partial [Deltaproteobacteria bacterium]|nr:hypothetical protein [Deltaproteobacteria bacterium]
MSSRGWKGWSAGTIGSAALHGGALALAIALLDDEATPAPLAAHSVDESSPLAEPAVTIEVEASLDAPPTASDDDLDDIGDDIDDDIDDELDDDIDGDIDDDIDALAIERWLSPGRPGSWAAAWGLADVAGGGGGGGGEGGASD